MADPLSRIVRASLPARRALALGLLAAAVVAAGSVVWIAGSSIGDLRREFAEKREALGRYQTIAALKPALARDNKAAAADGGDFLEGDSEAVAHGNMQRQLNAILSEQNANLLSISNIPELQVGNARYVGIRADLSGPVDAVYNAIFAIETSKAMIIRNASIWLSGFDEGQAAARAPEILARIQVYGALRPDLEAPQAKAEK